MLQSYLSKTSKTSNLKNNFKLTNLVRKKYNMLKAFNIPAYNKNVAISTNIETHRLIASQTKKIK